MPSPARRPLPVRHATSPFPAIPAIPYPIPASPSRHTRQPFPSCALSRPVIPAIPDPSFL